MQTPENIKPSKSQILYNFVCMRYVKELIFFATTRKYKAERNSNSLQFSVCTMGKNFIFCYHPKAQKERVLRSSAILCVRTTWKD